ncbi:30S ribosomal protein S16 [Flavobacteriaceae bacterium]|nr:30S ribosomal protein S16 [Flavobacteriaceae bacterium]MDB3863042.1 30S ribosomal protein S16 [Flavobacteriaceae bacterium]MDC3354130.1 30S ribosomal protein S16 [Flavobacteriaceae bacterium]
MPVKIRLQRHGKKGKPFYWIVAADSRAKRDGRYLKKLGTYNPNTNPASINLNLEDTVTWLEKGAQPTDTARTLLSYKGVMIKHHLNGGVRKGALTQEEADKKFAAWLEEKAAKIQAKKDGLSKNESEANAKRLADEKAVSDKRLADAAAAEAEAAAEEAANEAPSEEAPAAEVSNEEATTPVVEETTEEAPAVEEAAPVAQAEETKAEEATPDAEATAEETKE